MAGDSGDRVFCTVKRWAVWSKDIYGVHSTHEAGFNMDTGAAPVQCKRVLRDQPEAGFYIKAGAAHVPCKRY